MEQYGYDRQESAEPVEPISPDDAVRQQRESMPSEVIATFNRFIGETILNGEAVIRQEDIVDELVEKGLDRAQIFKKGWLNVEAMYREKGWTVRYDRPAYNENHPATYTFRTP